MNVGGFPSHGMKQAQFGALRFQGDQFDARAMGAKAANDPASPELDEGIGAATALLIMV